MAIPGSARARPSTRSNELRAAAGMRWRALARVARRRPGWALLAAVVLAGVLLTVFYGGTRTAQVTLNGLVAGSYFALGAAGLTLLYGVLRLMNFAHGDMLTFAAYMAVVGTAALELPFAAAAVLAVLATALLSLGFEGVVWRPLRRRRAGALQLILAAIGLAFVLRYAIQFVAGTNPRSLGVDVTSTVKAAGVTIGVTQLIVLGVGYAGVVLLALMLRYTLLGKQLRALADNRELAEATGIDTSRLVLVTQVLAGGFAGLAGVLFGASIGVITPNVGFFLLLFLFAAVILGGIGNAFGALLGGVVIGLAQEWSTLLFEVRWKEAVGFVILIAMLVIRPQGLFGRLRVAVR